MTATQLVQTHGNKVLSGALIVALYVSIVAAGWFLAYLPAQAAPLSNISDTLSVSVPSSASNHTISFTLDQAIAAQGSISIDFQGTSVVFATGSVDFTDVDVASGGGDYSLAASSSGQTLGVTISGSALHIQLGGGGGGSANNFEAGEVLTVEIGTNATNQTTGDQQLTNPTSTTGTEITITTFDGSGSTLDSGQTFVAIQPQVTLQATVQDTFSFVVDGCTSAGSCQIDSFTVEADSTATLADFGTLTADDPITMGSSLSVTSNALNGFVVTVEQNHDMLASNGADIDCFVDGSSCGAGNEAAWASPTGTSGLENTYGHMGIHSEDNSDTAVAWTSSVSAEDDGTWVGFSGTTAIEVWDNPGTGDGVTQDLGHIDVGYRIEVTGLQEAGTYTNQLMYIATPTF